MSQQQSQNAQKMNDSMFSTIVQKAMAASDQKKTGPSEKTVIGFVLSLFFRLLYLSKQYPTVKSSRKQALTLKLIKK